MLIIFVARIALVLSRPIGQELGEKHEALTGENEIEGYDLGSDGKRVFQTEKPKSQIRFGYGLKFGYKGAALHGLNRYNLMVGLEIPDIRLAQLDHRSQIRNFVKDIIIHNMTVYIWYVVELGQLILKV